MKNNILFIIIGIIFGIMGCLFFNPSSNEYSNLEYSLELKNDSINLLIVQISKTKKINDSLYALYNDNRVIDSLKDDLDERNKIIDSIKNIRNHEKDIIINPIPANDCIEYIRNRYSRYITE